MSILSVVLFGSQVSGGSDGQSDKDLLVICKPENKKNSIIQYTDRGYSVSVYTPRQLESMRLHGSLFLQHLKLESKVMYDRGGAFIEFISKCDLVPPPLEEMERSRQSLINALGSPIGYGASWWLADYLFVLSRDYFIKYFARKGRVIFNVIQLSREIEKEFLLEKAEAETFLSLRKCKSIYRSGGATGTKVDTILSAWRDVLQRIISIPSVEQLSVRTYLFDKTIDEFVSTYELLRYVESLRIMCPDVRCESTHERHVLNMIMNPNHYSSTSMKGKKLLSSYLNEFRNEANKCVNADSQMRRIF